MHHTRASSVLLSFILVTGCSNSSSSDESTTTTVAATSTTTTTLPPLVSNLVVHVDPNSAQAQFAPLILEALEHVERQYPIRPGTVVLLYSQTDESVDWAMNKGKEVNCFTYKTKDQLMSALGWAEDCGIAMRLDGRANCDEVHFCRTKISTAAHEYFHVLNYQQYGQLPDGPSRWMSEGSATYFGYKFTYGDPPGDLSDWHVEQFRKYLKDQSRDPQVNFSFAGMDRAFIDVNFSEALGPAVAYLYKRAFLAVTLLVEKYGEDAVLVEYVDNITTTRDHFTAFEMTFGLTEEAFYEEFQVWIDAL